MMTPGDVLWFSARPDVWYTTIDNGMVRMRSAGDFNDLICVPCMGWITVISVGNTTPMWITFLYHGHLFTETGHWVSNQTEALHETR